MARLKTLDEEKEMISGRIRVSTKANIAREADKLSAKEGRIITPSEVVVRILEERFGNKKSILEMLNS